VKNSTTWKQGVDTLIWTYCSGLTQAAAEMVGVLILNNNDQEASQSNDPEWLKFMINCLYLREIDLLH